MTVFNSILSAKNAKYGDQVPGYGGGGNSDKYQRAYMDLLQGGYEAHGNMEYQNNVNSLYDQIMNYGDFSYDPQKDALFKMYRQQYNDAGMGAMKNQMGMAAAQTGGYNNSYAQTSGHGAYQQNINQLNDKSAQLYQNAFNMYQNNLNNKMNNFNISNDMLRSDREAYNSKLAIAKDLADIEAKSRDVANKKASMGPSPRISNGTMGVRNSQTGASYTIRPAHRVFG